MRQYLFDAAFLFCAFAGGSLVLAGAGVVGLGLLCWARDIAEQWKMRHGQAEDGK